MRVNSAKKEPELALPASRDPLSDRALVSDDIIKSIVIGSERLRSEKDMNKTSFSKLSGLAEILLAENIKNVYFNAPLMGSKIDTEISITEDDLDNESLQLDDFALIKAIDHYNTASSHKDDFQDFLESKAYWLTFITSDLVFDKILSQEDIHLGSLPISIFIQLRDDIDEKLHHLSGAIAVDDRPTYNATIKRVLNEFHEALLDSDNEESPEMTQDYLNRKILYQAAAMRLVQYQIKPYIKGAVGAHLHGPISEYVTSRPEYTELPDHEEASTPSPK